MPSLSSLNHYEGFVQDDMTPGKFASAEFVAVAMGPPGVSDLTSGGGSGAGDLVFPVGVVQNFNLTQNMALARVFELGSKRSYLFPGKTIGAVTFGRPYYHGPSLLRLVMAYYSNSGTRVEFPAAFENNYSKLHTIHISPGYRNIFMNLASDLFGQPHGELVVMKDTDGALLGTFYLEQCYIPGHSMAVDAQGIIWQEGVQVQYERLVPIHVSTAYQFNTADWTSQGSLQSFMENLDTTANELAFLDSEARAGGTT